MSGSDPERVALPSEFAGDLQQGGPETVRDLGVVKERRVDGGQVVNQVNNLSLFPVGGPGVTCSRNAPGHA